MTADYFLRLKNKVFKKKPVLKYILSKHGSKKLFDYTQEYFNINLNEPIIRRQSEFLGTVAAEVAGKLGAEVGRSVAEQLRKYYVVSTADHHGPICHPFFLTSNLLFAAPYFEKNDPLLKNVIVFSCSNVSLNNSSFPRGLLFNSGTEGNLKLQQLSFFAAQYRQCPVFNFPAYQKENIEQLKKNLRQKIATGATGPISGQKVIDLLDEVYLEPEVLSCVNYSDQVTKTNFKLWKKFFAVMQVQDAPNLIYLEQEGLVIRLIKEHHLYSDTTIHKLMFDPSYHALVVKYFNNINGAFSTTNKWGTYLYWCLPPGAKYRQQMWREDNWLVNHDRSYKVELKPEAILAAFERHELVPSMMLCYIIIAFFYGLKCLGGFSQVNYLTFMKRAYIKMQADKSKYKSIEVCARVQTKEIGGDFILAYLGGQNKQLVPATGLDLIVHGDHNTWDSLVNEAKEITLEEAINPLLPEFYKIVYPESLRHPSLSALTTEDVVKITGLDQKIKAYISVKHC